MEAFKVRLIQEYNELNEPDWEVKQLPQKS